MTILNELYQELIVDHSRHPRHFHKIPDAPSHEGFNPLCGDRVTVYLKTENNRIVEIGLEGVGCAISTASASLMTEALQGKSLSEAKQLFSVFHEMLTGNTVDEKTFGKLSALKGVCEFPMRVKCATLPWHTMMQIHQKLARQGERQ